ncbi:MAG: Fic family protein [Betaproteobacteria bacterium]|nr:Fic family protein [Betaproteobacteria bacterium]
MPKQLRPDELESILNIISQYADGIGVRALEKRLKAKSSRRTLIRRLNALVDQGRLRRRGEARALVYVLPPKTSRATTGEARAEVTLPALQATGEAESYVPLSGAGREVRDYVRQPVQQRKPVGYNREFVQSYRPNETFYLPPEIREHLGRIGRPPVAGRPAGTYARDILNRLLIDLSWASSRLEGNTYTRLDTENLIEKGEAAEGKDRREAQMILNHKRAIEFLVQNAGDIGFNTYTFFNLHALLSENLLANPRESGRIREAIVDIGGTVFHPLAIPQQIEEYFRLILDKAGAIGDPFEQAIFIMVHVPYLQPFIDVNKRVSRLGANISLIQRNLCPLSFVDVPEHAYIDGTLGVYELNRIELLRDVFVWAYERSCQRYLAVKQSLADPDPFRIKFRQALNETVATIVRLCQPATDGVVRSAAKALIPAADLDRFVAMTLSDLEHLHEGNLARYQLRLSEYRSWRDVIESPQR